MELLANVSRHPLSLTKNKKLQKFLKGFSLRSQPNNAFFVK